MATRLQPQVTSKGVTNFRINKSDDTHLFLLVPNVEVTIAAPVDSHTVSLSTTVGAFFMGRGDTVITFPAATESPTDLEMNPAIRTVEPGETLRIISNAGGFMEVAFYD